MSPAAPTIADIARSVIADVAPDQVGEFDFVAERFAASPAAARRARRPSNEPTASLLDMGGEALASVAVGLTTDICKDLIKLGVQNIRSDKRIRRLFHRGKIALEDPVPPLPEDHIEAVNAQVLSTVLAAGGDAATAAAVSAALVRSWPRQKS